MARPREVARLGLTFAPAAVTGLALEGPIERRLGTLPSVAAAQIAGGIAMALADRAPAGRKVPGALDHLTVGVAQAAALAPGVSRGGASLTAARLRGLERPAAARLSMRAALPVSIGAAVLKTVRALRGGLPPSLVGPFAAGAAASFASTLAARGLVSRLERASTYAPLAAYRVGLGLIALVTGRG
jgi:undecaprenyl-diphosphatase